MVNNFQFNSASVSDRGLSEKRPQNEDSFIELPEQGIFAVADGVGGAQAGDVASQMAMEILAEAFVNQTDTDPEEILRLAITRANTAIYQMSRDLPQLNSMATTIVALHLNGNIATIGHVGDSRLYRLDSNSRLLRETEDHSVVEEEVRAGRMTPEQALNHPSRNVISRALGAEETVDIDIKTIMFDAGSTFLLCSDGITRHIDDAEINQLLTAENDPSVICSQMKDLCYSRGAEDNLTAVIIKIPTENAAVSIPSTPSAAVAEMTEVPEPEEVTVATSRSPFDSVAAVETPAVAENDSNLSSNTDEEYASSTLTIPAKEQPINEPAFLSRDEDKNQPSGIFGKALAGLALLLLGILVGYGAGLLLRTEPEPVQTPPIVAETESVKNDLTSFEDGRRLVDADPARYVASRAVADPQTPEDYFLVGRALFLVGGKDWEAKKAFEEAKNRLSQADPLNAKTLAAEIAMALAIINDGSASQSFAKDMAAIKTAPADSNTNANSNSSNPANAANSAPLP